MGHHCQTECRVGQPQDCRTVGTGVIYTNEKFWVECGILHLPMVVLRLVIPILLCSGAPLQLSLEVQQLWKHKICKNCDKQMTQVEQWWCQTCDISQAGHGWPHFMASVAPVGFPSPQPVGIVVSLLPAMRDLSVKQVLSRNVTAVFFHSPPFFFLPTNWLSCCWSTFSCDSSLFHPPFCFQPTVPLH